MKFDLIAGQKILDLLERKKRPIDVVATPFDGWNRICGEEGGGEGLARRWTVIIGGVTGTGKSYLTSGLLADAVLQGKLVGNINMEMSQMAVATRYLAQLSELPQWRMDMGKSFSEEIWLKAKGVADAMWNEHGAGMLATDSGVFNLDQLAAAYDLLAEKGCRVIAVDYAQLVTVQGVEGIAQRSEAVANKIRNLTHEYDITTLCISQFNREEAKKGGPPSMHGLLGGGIWEHSANQIWLLDHTIRQGFGQNDRGFFIGEYTQLLNEKNRHGPANVELPVKRWFDSQRFEQYIPGTDEDDPFILEADIEPLRPRVEVPDRSSWVDHDDRHEPQEEMFA